MGHKQNARLLVAEHEFSLRFRANVDEFLDVFDAAAAAAATGGLNGKFNRLQRTVDDDSFSALWEWRGLGGVVRVMTFIVVGTMVDEVLAVGLRIDQYFYHPGQMFTKPTLGGGKQLMKLRGILERQLEVDW